MSSPDAREQPEQLAAAAKETGKSLYERTRDTLLTGVAITIPFVVTLYILAIGLEFVSGALNPFILVLEWFGVIAQFERIEFVDAMIDLGVYPLVTSFFKEFVALVVLFGLVALVGTVGRNRYGERIIRVVDSLVTSIPGIGTVYWSFRRMGDVMLHEGGENFQDVKLVECFEEDVYVLGFQTNDSPSTIEETAGYPEMVSIFLPLAPNPVTGGLLTYVPAEHVHDIDMTVEEGVRSILTSGVATGRGGTQGRPITVRDVTKVTHFDRLQNAVGARSDRHEKES